MSKNAKAPFAAVFLAFQEFQSKQASLANRVKNPSDWVVGFAAAFEEFKAKLETLGLADHIDWTGTESGEAETKAEKSGRIQTVRKRGGSLPSRGPWRRRPMDTDDRPKFTRKSRKKAPKTGMKKGWRGLRKRG